MKQRKHLKAAARALARDAEHWITVHPNGKENKGSPVLINGAGQIIGGAGGKLNGKFVKPKSKSAERPGTEGQHAPAIWLGPASNNPPSHPVTTTMPEAAPAKPKAKAPKQKAVTPPTEQPGSKLNASNVALTAAQMARREHPKTIDPRVDRIHQQEIFLRNLATENPSHAAEVAADLRKNAEKYAEAANVTPEKIGSYARQIEIQLEILNAKKAATQPKAAAPAPEAKAEAPQTSFPTLMGVGSVEVEKKSDNLHAIKFDGQTVATAKSSQEAAELAKALANSTADTVVRMQRKADSFKFKKEVEAKREAYKGKPFSGAQYKPAKTAKAAAKWAVDNGLVDHADFGKIGATTANAGTESLHWHLTEFPELRRNCHFVGATQSWNQYSRDRRVDDFITLGMEMGWSRDQAEKMAKTEITTGRVHSSEIAMAARAEFGKAVGFNQAWGEEKNVPELLRILENDVKSGFHPQGCATIRAQFDHEYGHQMDYLLGIRELPEVKEMFRGVKNFEAEISGYSRGKIGEFVAECWCEYRNNPTPRPLAKRMAEIIRSEYAKKFGQGTKAPSGAA